MLARYVLLFAFILISLASVARLASAAGKGDKVTKPPSQESKPPNQATKPPGQKAKPQSQTTKPPNRKKEQLDPRDQVVTLKHLSSGASPIVLLGELYDLPTDTHINSFQLWDKETLEKKNIYRIRSIQADPTFSMTTGDVISSLAASNVDARTKMNLLLNDAPSNGLKTDFENEINSRAQQSLKTVKASLLYRKLMYSHYIDFDQETSLEIENKPKRKATHFVSAIRFGVKLKCTFTQTVERAEDKEDMLEKLTVDLRDIAGTRLAGGSYNILAKGLDKNLSETFTAKCESTGYKIPDIEFTIERFAKEFERISAYNATGIESPQEIDLRPIAMFDENATANYPEVSESATKLVANMIHVIREIEEDMAFRVSKEPLANFTSLDKRYDQFLKLTEAYEKALQKRIKSMVNKVRSGYLENSELLQTLKRWRKHSPFTVTIADAYVTKLKSELSTMETYHELLEESGVKLIKPKQKSDFKADNYTVILTYTLPWSDSILQEMEKYTNSPDTWNTWNKTLKVGPERDADALEDTTILVAKFAVNKSDYSGVAFAVLEERGDIPSASAIVHNSKTNKDSPLTVSTV